MDMSRLQFAPLLLTIAVAVALIGCDSAGPSTDGGEVKVSFSTTSPSAKSTTSLSNADPDSLVLSGSNGTLQIADIRLIVDKVKVNQDTDDEGSDGTEVEIEREVEVERPRFLDLPLRESEISPVAAGDVPAGTYNELEFEIDDLDDDTNGGTQELLADIREEFSNWPKDASMIVVGTFVSSEGTATSFATYFEAEIEVAQALTPPVEVTSGGFSRELIVRLDPARWFERGDGTVKDLAQFDYEKTGTVKELEAEFGEGVAEIEYDDN
jgi:hypothetical protein